MNLPNQLARWVIHLHPVPTPGIQIPLGIEMDAIRYSRRDIGKRLAVLERPVRLDVEPVDGGGEAGVEAKVALDESRVCDVEVLSVGGEGDPVGHVESVCYGGYGAGGLVEAVYLFLKPWRGTEVLDVSVCWICEVDFTGSGVDGDVIDGVELAAEEVV